MCCGCGPSNMVISKGFSLQNGQSWKLVRFTLEAHQNWIYSAKARKICNGHVCALQWLEMTHFWALNPQNYQKFRMSNPHFSILKNNWRKTKLILLLRQTMHRNRKQSRITQLMMAGLVYKIEWKCGGIFQTYMDAPIEALIVSARLVSLTIVLSCFPFLLPSWLLASLQQAMISCPVVVSKLDFLSSKGICILITPEEADREIHFIHIPQNASWFNNRTYNCSLLLSLSIRTGLSDTAL